MRRNRVSARVFIVPIFVVILFCAAAVLDYARQHVSVNVLGTTINVSSIQQVLIEPSSGDLLSTQGYFTMTNQQDIQTLCKLISTATPSNGTEGEFATTVDNMLFQSSSKTIQITVGKSSHHQILLFYNNHTFIAPNQFEANLNALLKRLA